MKELGHTATVLCDPPEQETVPVVPTQVEQHERPRTRGSWNALVEFPDGEQRWMSEHELFCWVAQQMGTWILNGNGYPITNPDLSHLYQARDAILARLNLGLSVIEDQRRAQRDTASAESLWIELLEEYTLIEDQIALFA